MRLKCIGGPSNGRIVELSGSYLEITLPNPRVESFLTQPLADIAVVGPVHIMTTTYTRRILREATPDGKVNEIQYLAPCGATDLEALRFLLAA